MRLVMSAIAAIALIVVATPVLCCDRERLR